MAPSKSDPDELITLAEAGRRYGLSPDTLRLIARPPDLPIGLRRRAERRTPPPGSPVGTPDPAQAPTARARVTISSVPQGATVSSGGRVLGTTPTCWKLICKERGVDSDAD